MIERLHHVAVAVSDIDAVLEDYSNLLGLPKTEVVHVDSQSVKATLIPIGDVELELIEPTDPEGGVAKFIERRGESLHHICFQVPAVDDALKALEGKGTQLIDKQSRPGLAGMVGFLHPKSTMGTLVELCTPIHSARP